MKFFQSLIASIPLHAVAWVATLLCLGISARAAKVFLRHNPRLFTVLAMFACSWALLLPYYAGDKEHPVNSDLFAAIGGFLLIYMGGLLMLESQTHETKDHHSGIVRWQVIGVNLLGLIAVPPILKVAGQPLQIDMLSSGVIAIWIGLLLDAVGYTSIALGVKKLCGYRQFFLIATILFAYVALELIYILTDWTLPGHRDMGAALLFGFVVLKLLFTSILCAQVVLARLPDELKDKTKGELLMKFVLG